MAQFTDDTYINTTFTDNSNSAIVAYDDPHLTYDDIKITYEGGRFQTWTDQSATTTNFTDNSNATTAAVPYDDLEYLTDNDFTDVSPDVNPNVLVTGSPIGLLLTLTYEI